VSIRQLFRFALIATGILAVGLLWFVLQMYPIGANGRPAIVTVHAGDSMAVIADEMHKAGIIASPFAFRVDTFLFGSPLVRPGSYEIPEGSSFSKIRSIIGSLPNVNVINVRPGLTLNEVAQQVSSARGVSFADTFMRDAQEAEKVSPYRPNGTLEGLIGPGQYIVNPQTSAQDLLAAMMRGFSKMAGSVGFSSRTTVDGLSAYQVLIAASIVEKEGYYNANMPKVARVILNRLQLHRSLQMDSTVLYYLGQDGGKVTTDMLKLHTPYNTYLSPGLTPTPICVVSADALRAVLHAPPGPWLYFVVVDKNGTEAFSRTFSQQLANERLAQSRGLS
jgi:UPF0755 protein